MKNGPGMDHFGFGFEMVLAGLLPLGMDHFGSGLEMVLARGRGVPLSASSGDQERSSEGLLAERRRRPPSRFHSIAVSPTKEE